MLPREDSADSPRPGGNERWDAFESFVREQHPALCAYAYRYVRDRDVAEEVVQDVLFRVWCRRDRIAHLDLVPYVFRSVAHAAISRLRGERAIRNRDLRLQHEVAAHTDADALDTATDLEAQVRQAIEALPERCRLVFVLSRDAGLTYAAIAERLGISVKTVENQIVRALRLLRTSLRPHLGLVAVFAGVEQLVRRLL